MDSREELLNSLSRINELQVTGRTSSFYFKAKHADLTTIAHKLNVAAVLEGTPRAGWARSISDVGARPRFSSTVRPTRISGFVLHLGLCAVRSEPSDERIRQGNAMRVELV